MTTSEHLYYNCWSVVYRVHQSDSFKCSKDSFNYVRRCHEIDFDRAKTWTPKLKNRLTLVETGMASRSMAVTAKIQKINPWNKIYSLLPLWPTCQPTNFKGHQAFQRRPFKATATQKRTISLSTCAQCTTSYCNTACVHWMDAQKIKK